MIIGQSQIKHEIARVVSDKAYIQLSMQDFADTCPNPTCGIHVCMRSIDALIVVVMIYLELVVADKKELNSIIVYIRGSSLMMGDLSRIDDILPCAQRFRRGLGFTSDGTEIEIWIFAEVLQENNHPVVDRKTEKHDKRIREICLAGPGHQPDDSWALQRSR